MLGLSKQDKRIEALEKKIEAIEKEKEAWNRVFVNNGEEATQS